MRYTLAIAVELSNYTQHVTFNVNFNRTNDKGEFRVSVFRGNSECIL